MFINFLDGDDAEAAFSLTNEGALEYFKAKGLQPTFAWQDMVGEEHLHAFTVANMADTDLLADVYDAVEEAIASGTPLQEFIDELRPKMQAKGWWGSQPMKDPLTGQLVQATTGTPWRLATIYRTNMQSAYAVGNWEQITEQADVAPLLLYDAVDDGRTRPEHAQWDDILLPVTAKFWRTHYPPNGWNCRCGVIQLTKAEAEEFGYTKSKAPKIKERAWKNPRTGKKQKIPQGLDPGWAVNQGMVRAAELAQYAVEKAAAYPSPEFSAAAMAAQEAAAVAAENSAAIITAILYARSETQESDDFSESYLLDMVINGASSITVSDDDDRAMLIDALISSGRTIAPDGRAIEKIITTKK